MGGDGGTFISSIDRVRNKNFLNHGQRAGGRLNSEGKVPLFEIMRAESAFLGPIKEQILPQSPVLADFEDDNGTFYSACCAKWAYEQPRPGSVHN
jgi:hypothetical protein